VEVVDIRLLALEAMVLRNRRVDAPRVDRSGERFDNREAVCVASCAMTDQKREKDVGRRREVAGGIAGDESVVVELGAIAERSTARNVRETVTTSVRRGRFNGRPRAFVDQMLFRPT
jgi:hypothetical protein